MIVHHGVSDTHIVCAHLDSWILMRSALMVAQTLVVCESERLCCIMSNALLKSYSMS